MSADHMIELRQAQEDISTALLAFHGFMDMVKGGDSLNGHMLYCLLEPVEDRLAKGLEQLEKTVLHG